MTRTFLIDRTVGREAKFQMDFIVEASTDIERIEFKFPNGSSQSHPSPSKSPFIAKFDFLEVNRDQIHEKKKITFCCFYNFVIFLILGRIL